MAAMLMAGLDGMKNKIDPAAEGFGPIDLNITKMSPQELSKITPVPKDLDEALQAVEDDHDYLLAGGVFPEDSIDVWVNHKLENDVKALGRRTHPYEVALYFDL